MDINVNLHLTLQLAMLKVKVTYKGHNEYCSSRHIRMKFESYHQQCALNGPRRKFTFDLESTRLSDNGRNG